MKIYVFPYCMGFVRSEIIKKIFLLVCYIYRSKKSYRQDKFPVCTYLPSIISYSNNVSHPTSEYFPIREYYDIHTIMPQIS